MAATAQSVSIVESIPLLLAADLNEDEHPKLPLQLMGAPTLTKVCKGTIQPLPL